MAPSSPSILLVLISWMSFISGMTTSVGQTVCDSKVQRTLGKDAAGTLEGSLWSREKMKCLFEFKLDCKDCYVDVVLKNMVLAVRGFDKGPRVEHKRRSGLPDFVDEAVFVQEDFNERVAVFQGDVSGTFFISSAKKITVIYHKGSINHAAGRDWTISYKVHEIKHQSCYWGVHLKHTCPDGSCTDAPRDCGKHSEHLERPPEEASKGDKTKIFIGLMGALFGVVIITAIIVCCAKRHNRRRLYKCCTKPCKRNHKEADSDTGGDTELQLVHRPDEDHIIIDSVSELPEYKDAVDMTTYPKPGQNGDALPSYEEAANADA